MEEIRGKHKSIQNAAHHIALDCIHPQESGKYLASVLIVFDKYFMIAVHISKAECFKHQHLFTVWFVHLCLYHWDAQSAHGSPYHVHPYPSPVRLQHAFQATQHSPKMFHPKGLKPHLDPRAYGTPTDSPILGRALCLTPKGSPLPVRMSHLNEKFQDSLTLNADTDALVAKISAMFPTVSETHIKILLKKYYNREAVVISALQVEKHPITTPGPLTMSPSAARLQKGAIGVYSALQFAKGLPGSMQGSTHFTPLTGTPQGSPLLLRPASGGSSYYGTTKSIDGQPQRHHSPKMKLKYLKSIFPKAEETLILDILANKDNNVQKASEELITMGFTKKETVIAQQKKKEKDTPQPPKKVTLMKTLEEKNELKKKLQDKYKTIAERVISIALESVEYNEVRAEQILNAVLTEEETPKVALPAEVKQTKHSSPADAAIGACASETECKPSPLPLAPPRRLKTWTEHLKPILKSSINTDTRYKSQYSVPTNGPNPALRQGPKDSLLLEDYMAWNGPNPDAHTGQSVKVEGPEPRQKKFSLARGPSGLANGPAGIAKGSIYQKLNKKSAKIVV